MPRHTPLAKVLQIFKGECKIALSPGAAPAQDEAFLLLIEQRQQWLAGEYDWPFLESTFDVAVDAADRYGEIPTSLNQDRPFEVEVLWNDRWQPVEKGIGLEEYNVISSGDGGVPIQSQDPIWRWGYKPGDDLEFEVWPIPVTATTLRFKGQRQLTSLRNEAVGGFAFQLAARVDLDSTLVALVAAAEYWA